MRKESNITDKKERIYEILFIVFVFLFLFIWAKKAPLNSSPDEYMRFDVAEYIVNHGSLPDGRDPEIRNPNWGISYAFNPMTTCILAAVFAKTVSFFSDDFELFYLSMRMVNVIFGTLLAFVTLRIGKRLFKRESAWFFTILVVFLPGAAFLHTYLNMDSVAMLATACIFHCWVCAVQEGWHTSVCIRLGLSMSLCVLSYYNAYGFLLCSAFLFAGMMLKCGEKQWNYQEMFKKGFLMLGIVALCTGWWFIRNAILYDGDFLGMSTSDYYAELYAIEELKPSNRATPQSLGMTLTQMLFWIPGGWHYNWMGTVMASFVGTFGFMDIFMPELWTKVYLVFLGVGVLGNIFCLRKHFSVSKQKIGEERIPDNRGILIVKRYRREQVWNGMNWMRICLVIAMLIPVGLLLYYAYASDFQAQGRYIMPGFLPLVYFITLGYETWLDKWIRKDSIKKIFWKLSSAAIVISGILVYVLVYAPNYL